MDSDMSREGEDKDGDMDGCRTFRSYVDEIENVQSAVDTSSMSCILYLASAPKVSFVTVTFLSLPTSVGKP